MGCYGLLAGRILARKVVNIRETFHLALEKVTASKSFAFEGMTNEEYDAEASI